MRSFPTLRDAEIAYAQLEDRIGKLEKKTGISTGGSSGAAGPVVINNNIIQECIDSVLTGDGTRVLHQLLHIFQNGLHSAYVNSPGLNFIFGETSGQALWSISGTTDLLTLSYFHPTFAKTFFWRFESGATEELSHIHFKGSISDTSNRLSKLSARDFSALPGLIPSVSGQVLTAVDTIGNAVWSTPAIPSIPTFSQQAFITVQQNFPPAGTWADVVGCSVNVTLQGKYLVICNAVIGSPVNDIELQIRAVQNQPGAFFAMSGNILFSKPPGEAIGLTMNYCWILTVNTVPCTVKLEAHRVGTGTSYMDVLTSLVVTKVG